MGVLPGSHTQGIVPHTKGVTGWEVTEEMVPRFLPGLKPLQCPVRSGGAIVVHGNVLHKSEPDRSDRNRCAIVLDFDKQHNDIIRVNKETHMMRQFGSIEVWRRSYAPVFPARSASSTICRRALANLSGCHASILAAAAIEFDNLL
jgi:ectoine hydroxylase-related dioxygenase (phytanoyl-CoA dioxygenase family)